MNKENRHHQTRYHGVLAPSASGRDQVVPGEGAAVGRRGEVLRTAGHQLFDLQEPPSNDPPLVRGQAWHSVEDEVSQNG
jgi:hypothetical protein